MDECAPFVSCTATPPVAAAECVCRTSASAPVATKARIAKPASAAVALKMRLEGAAAADSCLSMARAAMATAAAALQYLIDMASAVHQGLSMSAAPVMAMPQSWTRWVTAAARALWTARVCAARVAWLTPVVSVMAATSAVPLWTFASSGLMQLRWPMGAPPTRQQQTLPMMPAIQGCTLSSCCGSRSPVDWGCPMRACQSPAWQLLRADDVA